MRKPYPHQVEMVEYLKSTENPALLVEMRLGKSHALIRAFRKNASVLVVCPKSVMGTWQDEFRNDKMGDVALVDSVSARALEVPSKWTVANYEAVSRIPESTRDKFDVVILDEAVRIKNPKAKTTKFFLDNFRTAQRCIASGNIAPESPLEYFSPMKFLNNKFMGCDNFWQFRKAFFSSDRRGWQWWVKNKKVMERIRDEVRKNSFILTRKQAGLNNKKIYQKRYVVLPPELRRLYKKMEDEFAMTLPSGDEIEVKHVIAQVAYLSQLAGGGTKREWITDFKMNELVELLVGELAQDQVVVWFRYNWEIKRARKLLHRRGVPLVAMTGSCSADERRYIQAQFRKKEKRVLLIQVKVGLYGLNLSCASTAVYFSNPLSGNERTQSEDRIEHNDKKEPLLYVDLLAKDTIDEDVYNALRRKHKQSRYFLGEVVENFRERHALAVH